MMKFKKMDGRLMRRLRHGIL